MLSEAARRWLGIGGEITGHPYLYLDAQEMLRFGSEFRDMLAELLLAFMPDDAPGLALRQFILHTLWLENLFEGAEPFVTEASTWAEITGGMSNAAWRSYLLNPSYNAVQLIPLSPLLQRFQFKCGQGGIKLKDKGSFVVPDMILDNLHFVPATSSLAEVRDGIRRAIQGCAPCLTLTGSDPVLKKEIDDLVRAASWCKVEERLEDHGDAHVFPVRFHHLGAPTPGSKRRKGVSKGWRLVADTGGQPPDPRPPGALPRGWVTGEDRGGSRERDLVVEVGETLEGGCWDRCWGWIRQFLFLSTAFYPLSQKLTDKWLQLSHYGIIRWPTSRHTALLSPWHGQHASRRVFVFGKWRQGYLTGMLLGAPASDPGEFWACRARRG